MTEENNLFTATAFKELEANGFTVEERTETVYYGTVIIDGYKFDAIDLRDTLAEVKGRCNIVITNEEMVTVLKKYGIIESAGNFRWCVRAEGGANLEKFSAMLEAKFKKFKNYRMWEDR